MPTPFAARQLVSHGHVKVNGRRVTIASYHVKDKDTIELAPKAREMALVMEASKSAERDTPDYLEVSEGKSAKLLRTPKLADVPLCGADGAASDRRILFALKSRRFSRRHAKHCKARKRRLRAFSLARPG